MIQFKRGKTNSWRKLKKPLDDGQPGYDKEKHKIKVGDGETSWDALPYASGLNRDEIISSEKDAKKSYNPILSALGIDESPIFTYGTEAPDKDTIGEVYLQHYDAEPETDYIVECGVNADWYFQKWNSGIAKCFKTFKFTTTVQTPIGDGPFYQNTTAMERLDYPFKFKYIPSETYSIQSPGGLVWLASAKDGTNTTEKTGVYTIVSLDKLSNSAVYQISVQAKGIWR
jgi:hypothetical protein